MKKRESVSNSLFSLFYWIFFTPTIDIEPKKLLNQEQISLVQQ